MLRSLGRGAGSAISSGTACTPVVVVVMVCVCAPAGARTRAKGGGEVVGRGRVVAAVQGAPTKLGIMAQPPANCPTACDGTANKKAQAPATASLPAVRAPHAPGWRTQGAPGGSPPRGPPPPPPPPPAHPRSKAVRLHTSASPNQCIFSRPIWSKQLFWAASCTHAAGPGCTALAYAPLKQLSSLFAQRRQQHRHALAAPGRPTPGAWRGRTARTRRATWWWWWWQPGRARAGRTWRGWRGCACPRSCLGRRGKSILYSVPLPSKFTRDMGSGLQRSMPSCGEERKLLHAAIVGCSQAHPMPLCAAPQPPWPGLTCRAAGAHLAVLLHGPHAAAQGGLSRDGRPDGHADSGRLIELDGRAKACHGGHHWRRCSGGSQRLLLGLLVRLKHLKEMARPQHRRRSRARRDAQPRSNSPTERNTLAR